MKWGIELQIVKLIQTFEKESKSQQCADGLDSEAGSFSHKVSKVQKDVATEIKAAKELQLQ
jgi:hypothetical protein